MAIDLNAKIIMLLMNLSLTGQNQLWKKLL